MSEIATEGSRVIVVGIDGSPASLRAAAYATGVARREKAKLIGVYVRQPPLVIAGTLGTDASAHSTGAIVNEDLTRALHRDLAAEHAFWGIDCELVLREGLAANEILKVADEESADEIVVGCSRSLRHRLFGSLASRLIRRGKWVITIVP